MTDTPRWTLPANTVRVMRNDCGPGWKIVEQIEGRPRPSWEKVTTTITGGIWRGHASSALASLAQHRDDIARVICDAEDSSQGYRARGEHPCTGCQRDADAVLAYLTGGAR